MKRLLTSLTAGAALAVAGASFGAPPGGPTTRGPSVTTTQPSTTLRGPTATGQPGVECGAGAALTRPGQAEFAPGSAFNPSGKAGTVYAGEQPQNSRNTASVSQYDTACLHAK